MSQLLLQTFSFFFHSWKSSLSCVSNWPFYNWKIHIFRVISSNFFFLNYQNCAKNRKISKIAHPSSSTEWERKKKALWNFPQSKKSFAWLDGSVLVSYCNAGRHNRSSFENEKWISINFLLGSFLLVGCTTSHGRHMLFISLMSELTQRFFGMPWGHTEKKKTQKRRTHKKKKVEMKIRAHADRWKFWKSSRLKDFEDGKELLRLINIS